MLNKYSKPAAAKTIKSEGSSFTQKGGRGGGKGQGKGKDAEDDYDKKYWADKKCYKCDKQGHPALHCPKKDKEDDDDDKSRASSAKSVKKLTKDLKDMKKKFSMINTQLTKLQEVNSDVSRSEAEEEDSHFQTHAFPVYTAGESF